MEVFEQMQRFKFSSRYSHDSFVVRCWLSLKNEEDQSSINSSEFYNEIEDIIGNKDVYSSDCIKIAKRLALKFGMNACEVIEESNGYGAVYYREWP